MGVLVPAALDAASSKAKEMRLRLVTIITGDYSHILSNGLTDRSLKFCVDVAQLRVEAKIRLMYNEAKATHRLNDLAADNTPVVLLASLECYGDRRFFSPPKREHGSI